MEKTRMRTSDTKPYVRPQVSSHCLSDDDTHLLATSTGQFEDMGSGGDLGGDSGNSGSFNDMGGGGDLGGNSGNGGAFSDMLWGGDLGGTVTGGGG